MAYRFKLKEGLCEGVRRIGVEQIAKVLETPHDGDNRALWVHETRKTMKRTRALLKCVRSGLGDGPFRAENAALRDIARDLSGLRDRDVMAGTIANLRGQDKKLDAALAWLTKELHMPRKEAAAHVPESPDTVVRQTVKALQKAKDRLATIDVAGEFGETVGTGLRTSQRVGREALARLTAEPSDENVHDLRKAVQIYQRQQSLVLAIWPEVQSVRVEAARALAQLLGEAQDFAVLAEAARSMAEKATPAKTTYGKRVAAACRKRQELIRDIAVPMAARLFATRPKSVEQELKDGWEAAVSLAAAPHQPMKVQVPGAG